MYDLLNGDVIIDNESQKQIFKVISKVLYDGKIELFSSQQSSKIFFDYSEIYQNIAFNRWSIKRLNENFKQVRRKNLNDMSLVERYSTEEMEKLNFYQNILIEIESIMNKNGCSFNKALEYYLKDSNSSGLIGKLPPSKSTIYRVKVNKDKGRPLLSGNISKGNRNAKVNEKVRLLTDQFINEYFIQPHSPFDKKDAIEYINHELKISLGEKFKITRKYFKSRLMEICPNYKTARLLPKERPNARSIATKRIIVAAPFERVELDCISLPFRIQSPYGVVSVITLMIALECFTSSVVGWQIVLGTADSTHTLKCLNMAMNPQSRKKELNRLGIIADNGIYGAPRRVVWDNGPEFKGERLAKLPGVGIATESTQSHTGAQKPFIERFNRTLKEAIGTLPGTTRLNGKDGQRDPVALEERLMTLDELEQWVVRFMFELYPTRPLERFSRNVGGAFVDEKTNFGTTPRERCMAVLEGRTGFLPLPVPVESWRSIEFETVTKKLSKSTGITHETFHYKHKSMVQIINQFGPSVEVTVRVNPDDFRHVFVELPTGESYTFSEEYLQQDTPVMSFRQAKQLKKENAKRVPISTPEAEAFSADLHHTVMNRKASAKPQAKKSVKSESKAAIDMSRAEDAISKIADGVALPPGFSQNLNPTNYIEDRPKSMTFEPVPTVKKDSLT